MLCCDFCHLVYHPRCLEVTPGPTSLFACSDCKEVSRCQLEQLGFVGVCSASSVCR